MSKIVLLDSGPLGILTNPVSTAIVRSCQRWVIDLSRKGYRVVVPEICDFDIRRELIRRGNHVSIQLLDGLATTYGYLSISTAAMRIAAELWAFARNSGIQTAQNLGLDADMILCAQALALNDPTAIVATGNVAHIGRFVPAADWPTIAP